MADIKRLLLKPPEVYGNLSPLDCCNDTLPSIPSEQTAVESRHTKQSLVVLRMYMCNVSIQALKKRCAVRNWHSSQAFKLELEFGRNIADNNTK